MRQVCCAISSFKALTAFAASKRDTLVRPRSLDDANSSHKAECTYAFAAEAKRLVRSHPWSLLDFRFMIVYSEDLFYQLGALIFIRRTVIRCLESDHTWS